MSEIIKHLEHNKPIEKSGLELKARRKFNRTIRRLTPEAFDFVSLLSSNFMEGDIYASYRNDPVKLIDLKLELVKYGVSDKDTEIIFRNFNLPVIKK